jgi:hypothetical protein
MFAITKSEIGDADLALPTPNGVLHALFSDENAATIAIRLAGASSIGRVPDRTHAGSESLSISVL